MHVLLIGNTYHGRTFKVKGQAVFEVRFCLSPWRRLCLRLDLLPNPASPDKYPFQLAATRPHISAFFVLSPLLRFERAVSMNLRELDVFGPG